MDLDLDKLFDFHPADTAQRQMAHDRVRKLIKAAATELTQEILPNQSPERTLAVRALQRAMFHANAALSFGEGDV